MENFDLIKGIVEITGEVEKYVVLREDENGRYIEWAFKEGAPHDNRCLSWYETMQPEALKRNGHDPEYWKNLHLDRKPVDTIYYLGAFTCGHENEEGENHCSPGHACEKCVREGYAHHWTYKEPVKCGCWYLTKIDLDEMCFSMSIDQIKTLVNKHHE